ncbi:rhomboid family intramembrane serine protease [Myxococcota bacterium]|nr:rhomboid family intramembrane serine protease [Myxococcota bacterium]
MIPLYDNVPTRRPPFVLWALVAINALVFLLELSLGEQGLQAFVETWGVVPREIALPVREGRPDPGEWVTLVTSQFLHGGWFHVIGNMLFLWVFGDNVEDRLGHLRFLAFYLAGGVAAGIAQVALAPASPIPMVGASGAVAAVLGTYLLLHPHARVRTLVPIFFIIRIIDVPAIVFLGYWFLIQLLSGSIALTSNADVSQGGVAFWAHVGGFVYGVVVGLALRAGRGPARRAGGRGRQSPW